MSQLGDLSQCRESASLLSLEREPGCHFLTFNSPSPRIIKVSPSQAFLKASCLFSLLVWSFPALLPYCPLVSNWGDGIAWWLWHWILRWSFGFAFVSSSAWASVCSSGRREEEQGGAAAGAIGGYFLIIASLPAAAVPSWFAIFLPCLLGPSRFGVHPGPPVADSLAHSIFPNPYTLCFLPSSQLLVEFRDLLKTYPNVHPPDTSQLVCCMSMTRKLISRQVG